MFSDSLISLMIMLLLCFAGMLVMFLFVIKSLTTQATDLREGFRRHEAAFADMERQLMEITFALRRADKRNVEEAASVKAPAQDFSDDLRALLSASSAAAAGMPAAAAEGGNSRPSGVAPAAPGAPAAEEVRQSRSPFGGDAMDKYPSAAGLDPFDEDLVEITFSPEADRRKAQAPGSMEPGAGKAFGKTRPGTLEIFLEN